MSKPQTTGAGERSAPGESVLLSRRELFRNAAIATGGATVLAAGLASSTAKADAGKKSKSEAGYQETPQGDQTCANCALFVAPASCGVVDGTISPSGWCKLYQKKG